MSLLRPFINCCDDGWPYEESLRARPWPGNCGYWNTADGRMLKISEMETSHIINTMAYLWRVGTLQQLTDASGPPKFFQDKIWELSAELQIRMTLNEAWQPPPVELGPRCRICNMPGGIHIAAVHEQKR